MEIIWDHWWMKKNVDKQVKIWYTLGRVAPIGALFLLIVCLIFDIEGHG